MFSIPSGVYSTLQAFTNSVLLTEHKAAEDAARRGKSYVLSALHQTSQAYQSLSHLNELEQVTGSIVSGKIKALWLLASPLIALGAAVTQDSEGKSAFLSELNQKVKHLPLKRSLGSLHNNAGSLYQIASLVTSLALLKLGCQAYAITSIFALCMGYLIRHNYVPVSVNNFYMRIATPIVNLGAILSNDRLLQSLTILNLMGDAIEAWSAIKMRPYDQVKHVSHLTYKQLEQIFEGKASLKVNRSHISTIPFPKAKSLDFDPLKKFLVDWNKQENFEVLKEAVLNDARFYSSPEYDKIPEEYQNILNELNDEKQKKSLKGIYSSQQNQFNTYINGNKDLIIKYAKNQINFLINDIENESIETNTRINYKVLKNYLGIIVEKLPHATSNQQTLMLARLATEGGGYCGPGVVQQLEKIAVQLLQQTVNCDKLDRLPLKQRLLIILQQDRLRIVEGLHDDILPALNPLIQHAHGGKRQVHAFNVTAQVFASNFGLPDLDLNHDLNAPIDSFDKFLYQKYHYKLNPDVLWINSVHTYKRKELYGYTKNRILSTLLTEVNTGNMIVNADIYAWANKWLEQVEATHKEKKSFAKALQSLVDFKGKNITNDQFKIHPCLFQAMLVDMGILEIA